MKTLDQIAAARYQEHERQCAEIRQENARLLKEFAVWIRQQGLSASTVRMHLCNADLATREQFDGHGKVRRNGIVTPDVPAIV